MTIVANASARAATLGMTCGGTGTVHARRALG